MAELIRSNLVRLRDRAGLTQAEAADVSGVPVDNLRRYESGKSGIDAATLKKIADAYGRPVDHFYMAEPPDVDAGSLPVFFLRTRPGVEIDSELFKTLLREVEQANQRANEIRKKKAKSRS